jgi:hypothetical protein
MDRSRFIPHPFRRFSMDKAVVVVCGELMQISLAFSAYYPLCLGGQPCDFAEAVERLIRRAASARGAEELLEVMEGRVRLEELGCRTRRWRPSQRSLGLSRLGWTPWPPPSSASTSACGGGAA